MPATKKAAAKTSSGKKPGLYANIQAKRERIAHGSDEHMRKASEEGAPAGDAFEKTARKAAAKKATAKKPAAKKAPAKKAAAKKTARKTAAA